MRPLLASGPAEACDGGTTASAMDEQRNGLERSLPGRPVTKRNFDGRLSIRTLDKEHVGRPAGRALTPLAFSGPGSDSVVAPCS